MPWKEVSLMSQREEFVALAAQPGANRRLLCKRFGISPTTGYKWLARAAAGNVLADRSRRPLTSPQRTADAVEQHIVQLRDAHPAWGPRKLKARLGALGESHLPAVSTVAAILERHGRVPHDPLRPQRDWQRFEREQPNELWQMDFKGPSQMLQGTCHALTVLDDHSRFLLCLAACPDQTGATVQTHLTDVFRRYGLPVCLLTDNGTPWGNPTAPHPYTTLTVWLLRLDVAITHGRPRHPQTQGKDERFHRTLNEELLCRSVLTDLAHAQHAFDQLRDMYNLQRPHEALNLATPASCYQPSPRPFPETLPSLEYAAAAQVRKISSPGCLFFHGYEYRFCKAFLGYPVGLLPTDCDGVWTIYFGRHAVAQLDERTHAVNMTLQSQESSAGVHPVSEHL